MITVFAKAHLDELVKHHQNNDGSSAEVDYKAHCDLCEDVISFYGGDRFDYDDAKTYLADKHGIEIS